MAPERIADISVVSPAGRTHLPAATAWSRGSDSASVLTVELGDAGTYVAGVSTRPREIVGLARATYRKMVQNLWWATGYNAVAIPLAAGVLASAGILLSPALGAVLMSASTVIVALNAQLLGRGTSAGPSRL